jgi:hypothetical protein
MKKRLLSAVTILCLGTASSYGQISLNQYDMGTIGLQIQQAHDTLPPAGTMPGPKGANQTWNFAGISQDFVDTVTFTNPSWTPNGSNFPTANLAILAGGAVIYITNTSTSATSPGVAADFTGSGNMVSAKNTPPEVFMNWPATYGNNFQQTLRRTAKFYYGQDPGIGVTIDSVRLRATVIKTDTLDAWGSVTTPMGTFNSLRVKEYIVEYDSIDAYVQFVGWQNDAIVQQDSTLTYSWWAKNIGYQVVQMTMDIPNDTVTSVSWLRTTPSNTSVNELSVGASVIYPNPASDAVTFVIDNTDASMITVYDVTGRIVNTVSVTGLNTTRLNVSEWSNGIYSYRVTDQAGNLLQRGNLSVSK